MADGHTISIDIANLREEAVGEHGLDRAHIENLGHRIRGFRSRLKMERAKEMHAYLELPGNALMLEEVLRLTQPRLGKFRHLVLLGIGGSSLGLRTLVRALGRGAGEPAALHVVDNTDPALLNDIRARIELKDTLFVAVSKSGGTIETVIALGYFAGELRKSGLELADHVIAVTDPARGNLRAFADDHGLPTADIPPGVGGRFSALTAAGLVPAALLNIDVAALLRGAARTVKLCSDGAIGDDWAARLGLLAVDLCRDRGKTGIVFMPYSWRLERLSDWFVQLWDESLGKGERTDGTKVQSGQTAIRAVGATDQHSQLQLFLEGPNDKLLVFVRVNDHAPDSTLGDFEWEAFGAGFVKGRTLGEVINAQQAGTAQACTERQRPNVTLHLPEVGPETLGELMMGLEIATTYAGHAFGVNPYDQPSVELGKRISRRMLGGE